MKTLRQLCAGAILILSFALFTYADDGHIPCPGVASQADIAGQMDAPPLTEIAVSLIASVLSLS